ncbi:hypothetical protein QBC38DRAFT_510544 [Podospora fimiseda]|uniref:Association with the SNF1 complex (ASC) domain-containing protein n=1 Tax=Podospora fimiseda TaxID=252190 RepID=A0AAN7BMX8_9PEZI|nr:hypothetical protein QBC38DRAFT_510544 [Podospora fimiseda]
MGNNPSTSKPSSQHSSYQYNAHNESASSPRPIRRDNNKHPIPVHHRRVAAPPESFLTQGQGNAAQPLATNDSSNNGQTKTQQHRIVPSTDSYFPETPSPASKPVDVKQGQSGPIYEPAKPVPVPYSHNSPSSPRSPRSPRYEERYEDHYEAAAMPHSSMQDMSYLTRPPRLPLPIEEEVHTPGSPIIAPTDIGEPLEDVDDLESGGPRPLSTLSVTGLGEGEEYEETDELLVDKTKPTVPTKLTWRHGGDKVFLTGTALSWNRKMRLHPVEGKPGVFEATLNIHPGTHHVRFLVDGQMCTTPDYPTTVDFGNNLVNYIEVTAPDDGPGAAPGSVGASATKDAQPPANASGAPTAEEGQKSTKERADIPPTNFFKPKFPQYLLDFDLPEDSPNYHDACAAIERLPNPPALPGFLGKPILNAATLIKDDNSVLNMPNHTVLNHLATSSIKNNILAVSATTRYKNKYVTTIMYKPTMTEGI